MANVDRVNGFRLVGNLNGPHNSRIVEMAVQAAYGTAIFKGDVVVRGGNANSDGIMDCEAAVATGTFDGVVVGIKVNPSVAATQHPGYIPASTGGTVYVCIDPNAIYEVQESGNIGTAGVGMCADITVAAGSTTTGASGMEIDSTSVLAASGQFSIIGHSRRSDNEPANANSKLLVVPNEVHLRGAGTGIDT